MTILFKKILDINKKFIIYHIAIALFFQLALMMTLGEMDILEFLQAIGVILLTNSIPYIIKKSHFNLNIVEWILLEVSILIEAILLFIINLIFLIIVIGNLPYYQTSLF